MTSGNGWNRHEEHVLRKLEELRGDQKRIYEEIQSLGRDVAALKVKAGVWGMLGGLVPVVIFLVGAFLQGM